MPLYSAAFRAAIQHRAARAIPVLRVGWPTGDEMYSDRPVGFAGIGACRPSILSISPFTFGVGLRGGGVAFSESVIALDNHLGRLTRIIEGGVDPAGSEASLFVALPGLAEADWHVGLAGVIGKPAYRDRAVEIRLRANDAPMRGTMPKAQILKSECPSALDSSHGVYLPYLYGEHDADAVTSKGMVPLVNWQHGSGAGDCRYALCIGRAKAVSRVYVNGTLQTLTTDYVVSYPIIGGKQITSIDLTAAALAEDIVVTADAEGYETVGDGTGELILNPVDQFLHKLTNFGFGDYRYGTWLDPADYPLDLASFAQASAFAATLGYEGGDHGGGTTEAEQILDAAQRWLGSWLAMRAFWTPAGKLAVRPLSFLFRGYESPGYPSAVAPVFLRPVHEIGNSFIPSSEPTVYRRVDLSYLFGAHDQKYFQSLAVTDVSQAEEVNEAFSLANSAPRLV